MTPSELAPLLTRAGPFVTVYLPTHRDSEQAAAAFDVLWRDVLRDLESRGVAAGTRQALSDARGSHTDGGTLVLVAAGDDVLLRKALPEAQDATVVEVGPLPHLLPLLTWAQARTPHVVVLTDHSGADVLGYADGAAPVAVGEVAPAEGPAHKTGRGGYGERRHQRTVENSWAQTAKGVAAAVEAVVDEVGARIVLLGGDPQSVPLVRAALSPRVAALVAPVRGGRNADGGSEHVADAVEAALRAHATGEVEASLEAFATYRGRATKDRARPITDDEGHHDPALAAADGLADTVAALRAAQVATLLLSDDLDSSARLWAGPGPLELGLTEEEVRALGVQAPYDAPVAAVLVRAALGAAADVRLVTAGTASSPQQGVGALLRYTAPAA